MKLNNVFYEQAKQANYKSSGEVHMDHGEKVFPVLFLTRTRCLKVVNKKKNVFHKDFKLMKIVSDQTLN